MTIICKVKTKFGAWRLSWKWCLWRDFFISQAEQLYSMLSPGLLFLWLSCFKLNMEVHHMVMFSLLHYPCNTVIILFIKWYGEVYKLTLWSSARLHKYVTTCYMYNFGQTIKHFSASNFLSVKWDSNSFLKCFLGSTNIYRHFLTRWCDKYRLQS